MCSPLAYNYIQYIYIYSVDCWLPLHEPRVPDPVWKVLNNFQAATMRCLGGPAESCWFSTLVTLVRVPGWSVSVQTCYFDVIWFIISSQTSNFNCTYCLFSAWKGQRLSTWINTFTKNNLKYSNSYISNKLFVGKCWTIYLFFFLNF